MPDATVVLICAVVTHDSDVDIDGIKGAIMRTLPGMALGYPAGRIKLDDVEDVRRVCNLDLDHDEATGESPRLTDRSQRELDEFDRRVDSCPDCGSSARSHTGSYCHECGGSLVGRA